MSEVTIMPDRQEAPRQQRRPLFELGQIFMTRGVAELVAQRKVNPIGLIQRHVVGDWGDLDADDKAANDHAVKCGDRVLSSYAIASGAKVWIITEWDRSVTTLLLPSEY